MKNNDIEVLNESLNEKKTLLGIKTQNFYQESVKYEKV